MKKTIIIRSFTGILFLTLVITLTGCGNATNGSQQGNELSGEVKIDGSSTVFPITEAIAEEFSVVEPNVRVPIGISGTGGGFGKFAAGETDISNASRPIKEEEANKAREAGIDYLELLVAYDGLSVMVNPNNTWVDYLTTEELESIWSPDSTILNWNDIRPEWPAERIKFYAPGTDSGTFDYFTEEINGKSGAIRPDFTGSEDDNVLVQGIAGDKNAIGFFGYAYYAENKEKLKIVPIDNGDGPVIPDFTTIQDGSYSPLSRPIFIYINKESLTRPEVKAFVTFYLEVAADIIPDVGYVALTKEGYEAGLEIIN